MSHMTANESEWTCVCIIYVYVPACMYVVVVSSSWSCVDSPFGSDNTLSVCGQSELGR